MSHEDLIVAAIRELSGRGATGISADHVPGLTRPGTVGGYIPDVTAMVNGYLVVVEAESEMGLCARHTRDQWKTFHRHVSSTGGAFVVVVSAADALAARKLVSEVCGNAPNAHLWTF